MSNESGIPEQDGIRAPGTESGALRIQPRETDLGGFSVRRLLPHPGQRRVGPWVFFDHFGPVAFGPGRGIDVRPHPHINLATVTYLFDGEILHRDSLGSQQAISPGAINLMIAGKGIVHSEREREAVRNSRHTVHGLQLWLGLPEADEEMPPEFLHYPAEAIPSKVIDGAQVTVMMGSAYGVISPVRTFSETLYLEARLRAGGCLTLPSAAELAIYVVSGSASIGGELFGEHTMVVLAGGAHALVEVTEEAHIVMVGGAKMSNRFIDWNFVSSRRDRIEQAKHDWRHGRFPKVPGDEEAFIPLPD